MLKHGEDLLSYEILESARNAVEGKVMMWINLAKKIIGLHYPNRILVFLALGVLISNIKASLHQPIHITINSSFQFNFSDYIGMRECQSWEMNEYTKRLPSFIERSLKKFSEAIQLNKE